MDGEKCEAVPVPHAYGFARLSIQRRNVKPYKGLAIYIVCNFSVM